MRFWPPRLRLWPRSMFGQTALVMATALLVAQAVSFFLIVNERQRAALVETSGPALTRFADIAKEIATIPAPARADYLRRHSNFDQRYALAESSTVTTRKLERDAALEQRLTRALARADVAPLAIEASNQPMAPGPLVFGFQRRGPPPMGGQRQVFEGADLPPGMPPPPEGPPSSRFPTEVGGPQNRVLYIGNGPPGGDRPPRFQEITLSAKLADGQWLNSHYRSARAPTDFLWRLAAAAITLYVIVLGAALFIAERLARPFKALTQAAEQVGVRDTPEALPSRGPQDVRAAIDAFNAMAQRVTGLLDEKDRMLGAIGHDLRTPLASLRIRAESIQPEPERERVIETLDHMAQMLEDILNLARLGRSHEPARLVDLSALADSVVEEFRDLGKDVVFAESARAPILCQRALSTRLVRNLIENAVKFGARARVSVSSAADGARIIIDDDGPGIPPEDLARVTEAFVRLDGSRSSETGGVGLGLSIATAIAASQGASLVLENRTGGGLRAIVYWPSKPA
jgi:signal transduction histidine kinase